jgi:hypothetical protein
MLIPFILTATTLLVPQDAAEPAAAAPQAAEVEATSTPDNVRSFLEDAQGRLYDPLAAGLTSLEFDLPVDIGPPIGQVSTVHMIWAVDGETSTTVNLEEGLELPPMITREALEAHSVQQAEQFLGNMLNRHIGSLLETGVATMAGVQDGLVAVDYIEADAAEQGVQSQTFFFNDDSELQRAAVVIESEGPMGAMTINMTTNFVWRQVSGDDTRLLMDSQEVEIDMGMMTQSSKAALGYVTVGEIMLANSLKTTTSLPAMMGGGEQTQLVRALNLMVNGEPVADTPAAEPAEG